MVKELPSETQVGAIGWAQDQLYQLKAQVGQLEQQLEQVQVVNSKLNESTHKVEGSLQEAILAASQTPRLQEELNQAIALIVQLQDRQAETKERIEELGRSRGLDEDRDLEEWAEVVKRTEHLERQVDLLTDRQSGVDESRRHQTEEVALLRQQLQQMEVRLDAVEGKSARSLETVSGAEQRLSLIDSTFEELRQQNEVIGERARVTSEAVNKVEHMLEQNLEELSRMELLAERIELHRAERQRLEDRALRLEEELQELHGRTDQAEHLQGKLGSQQQGLASRLDTVQEQVEEQRSILIEQIRKLTATQDRTKRRQVQELERELREMKQFIAELTREEV